MKFKNRRQESADQIVRRMLDEDFSGPDSLSGPSDYDPETLRHTIRELMQTRGLDYEAARDAAMSGHDRRQAPMPHRRMVPQRMNHPVESVVAEQPRQRTMKLPYTSNGRTSNVNAEVHGDVAVFQSDNGQWTARNLRTQNVATMPDKDQAVRSVAY